MENKIKKSGLLGIPSAKCMPPNTLASFSSVKSSLDITCNQAHGNFTIDGKHMHLYALADHHQ